MSETETLLETVISDTQRVAPECLVEYVRHERTRTRYGGHQMTWRVNDPRHPLHGKYLPQYYPDKQRPGWSPHSKYAKQWFAFAGHEPTRWDRLPRSVFKNRSGIAQVVFAYPVTPGKPAYYKIAKVRPAGEDELCHKPDMRIGESHVSSGSQACFAW